MKKVIKTLAALALSLSLTAFVGCSIDSSNLVGSLGCDHYGGEATCTEAAICERCGESYGEIDPSNHDYQLETLDPTCTEQGSHTYTCKDCGDTYSEVIPETGHHYSEEVTAPTCTVNGYTTYTCECGRSYKGNGVLALGHTLVAGEVVAPTCTTGGYTVYTCSVCGHTENGDKVAANGHDYEAVVTDPTCTEDGYTTHTCSVCQDSYVDSETDALGHDYDVVVTDPTCTEGGYTTHTCSVCQDSYVDSETDALGHKDTNIDAKCEVCSKYFVPEVGEAFKLILFQANKKATYYFTGKMSGYYFAMSTDINQSVDVYLETAEGGYYMYFMSGETKNYIYAEKSGTYNNIKFGSNKTVWSWNDELSSFTTVLSGTELYMGTYGTNVTIGLSKLTFLSDDPSKIDVSQFPARAASMKDHVHENTTVVTDPTCTADGKVTTTCATCKTKVVEAGEPKTGHSFVAGTVTDPTCTAKGYTTYNCENCTATEKRDEVDATGHDYEDVVTAPTCTAKGYTTHTCSVCQNSYVDSETDMIDHTYVEGECACGAQDPDYEAHVHQYNEEVTDPTCTAQGYTTFTCACGDEYVDDYKDATGHSYNPVVTDATCTTDGYTTHTCAACGDKYTTDTVPATGHADADGDNVCDNCDESLVVIVTETLSFASTAQRVSQDGNKQVWKNGAITLTNNKAASTNAVANYSNPARFYAGSNLVIDCAKMTKIVFKCDSSSYATELKNSIAAGNGVTVSVSGMNVTVTFDSARDSFTIAKLTKQVRMRSMEVTHG